MRRSGLGRSLVHVVEQRVLRISDDGGHLWLAADPDDGRLAGLTLACRAYAPERHPRSADSLA